ncbi:MAG: type IX secretion system membrane protein PorP/SprF [Bacteroidales bacterium]|nr:type IX secretion system membrane protein PorP/SprF [Bacteroidales bacterium]
MKFRKVFRLIFSLIVVVFWQAGSVQGQQEPNFSQYMFYDLVQNPGAAGNTNAVCITGANRMQWTGFGKEDGAQVAPRTYFVAGSLPIRILRGGVGLVIMQDALGYEKTIGVKIGYAHQRNVGLGRLGIGTQVEFNNRSIDFSRLRPNEELDPLLQGLAKESDILIDFSLGLLYRVPDSYYIGISGLHLVQTKGKPISNESTNSGVKMKLDRTFFITGGYEYTFRGNPDFELLPSAIIETNLSTYQAEVNATVRYKETVWLGAGYRWSESVILLLGLKFKDFLIGYSYDINVSKLALPVFGGSHEIMLNYCFKLELDKGRKSYKNTRFL